MENLFEQWITARDKHAEESDMECRYDAFLEIKLLEAKAEIDEIKSMLKVARHALIAEFGYPTATVKEIDALIAKHKQEKE